MSAIEVRALSASPDIRNALSEILIETVAHGGSVSFMHPLQPNAAEAFWDNALAAAGRDERIIFGAWDGEAWSAVSKAEIDRWCADFASHRPGGGESVAELLERVRRWQPGDARVAVSHGGWMSGVLWLAGRPTSPPTCAQWPAAPKHGQMISL